MRPVRALIVFVFLGTAVLSQNQEYLISTIAGGAPPQTPVPGVNMPLPAMDLSVATDAMGNTYFVGFHCVFKLDQNGVVTRIAGNGRAGYSGDGGPATSAQLRLESMSLNQADPDFSLNQAAPSPYADVLPPGIAVDTHGNVYVADNGNYRVRKISVTGIITTVAGSGTPGFSGDRGPAISAQVSSVFGLAVDVAGNLLIADWSANRIRRVAADGSIATVAGTGDCGFTGGDGGPAVAAQFCGPTGIAADSAGNLFVTDTTDNHRIREISPDGSITTVAGAVSATSVAIDRAGNLFANDAETDGWNTWQVAKKISPSGAITTVAGLPCSSQIYMQPPCGADGKTATKTFFGGPLGLAVDSAGNLLVADGGDGSTQRISRVAADGSIVTVVGSCGGLPMFNPPDCQKPLLGDGGPAISAQLAVPSGVAVDPAGNLFIADYPNNRIRKVSADGIITTLAGNGTFGSAGDGGPAANAQMAPYRLTLDGASNLFLFDVPNRSIRKISPDGILGTVTVVVGGDDDFVVADSAGDLFIPGPNFSADIIEVSPDGTIRRSISAQLARPSGVAVDEAGNLFIAESQDHRIRKVTPDGIITTVAGNSPLPGPGGFSGDGGPAVNAQLNYPIDVAVDRAGNLYIADYSNHRIRRVSPDGIISTIAGNGTRGYSGDGGPATRASLWWPRALAMDGAGDIYVADSGNNAIRVLQPARRRDRR